MARVAGCRLQLDHVIISYEDTVLNDTSRFLSQEIAAEMAEPQNNNALVKALSATSRSMALGGRYVTAMRAGKALFSSSSSGPSPTKAIKLLFLRHLVVKLSLPTVPKKAHH